MITLTVQEAQGQLGWLIAQAHHGEAVVLSDGEKKVTLEPGVPFDPEQDSPELEAELLKAVDGPYTPYSVDEMRALVERAIRKKPAIAQASSGHC